MAKKTPKKKRVAAAAEPLPDDMFDEVEKFHNDNALQFDNDISESEGGSDGALDDDAVDESSDSDADLDAGGQLGKSAPHTAPFNNGKAVEHHCPTFTQLWCSYCGRAGYQAQNCPSKGSSRQ